MVSSAAIASRPAKTRNICCSWVCMWRSCTNRPDLSGSPTEDNSLTSMVSIGGPAGFMPPPHRVRSDAASGLGAGFRLLPLLHPKIHKRAEPIRDHWPIQRPPGIKLQPQDVLMSLSQRCSMNRTVRRGAVVVLLVFSGACGSSGPTSPSGTSQPPSLPSPTAPLITFPTLSGPSRTFMFDGELEYPVRDFTRQSRFVLYDNGAFVLQYPSSSLGDGRYRGAYQAANGVMMFLFRVSGPQRRHPMG
jgi:hypothetical protein